MEIQTNKEELNCYQSFLEDLEVNKPLYFDSKEDPSDWESVWFFTNEPEDEEIRFYVVISLAVFEVEQNKISPEMVGEVEYYYHEMLVENTLNIKYEDQDARKDCLEDLKKCYEILKEKNLL